MRPRLITAENAGGGAEQRLQRQASMRPRLITAENGPPADVEIRLLALQ